MKKTRFSLAVILVTLGLLFSSFCVAAAEEAEVPPSVYTGDFDLQDKYLEQYSKDKAAGVTTFDIYNADAFFALAALISSSDDGFAGCTITLKTDLVYNTGNAADWATNAPDVTWNTIGNDSKPFKGTFDGEGHTISGLYITGKNVGLFGRVVGATIKNVGVVNSYIMANGYIGSIVSTMYTEPSTVSGCYSEAILYATGYGVGGIVGLANTEGCVVEQCVFNGSISGDENSNSAGGILGVVGNKHSAKISDCINLGSVHTGKQRSAGIVGHIYDNATIERCINIGEVTSAKLGDDGNPVYNNCAFIGTIGVYSNNDVPAPGVVLSDCYLVSDKNQIVYGVGQDKAEKYSDMFATAVTPVQSASLTGEQAKTTLSKFDFEHIWSVVDGSAPVPTAVKTILDGVENQVPPTAGGDENPTVTTAGNDDVTPTPTPTTAKPAATEKPGTTTQAPAQSESDTTDAGNNDSTGGCSSSIALASMSVMLILAGACSVVCGKKKD